MNTTVKKDERQIIQPQQSTQPVQQAQPQAQPAQQQAQPQSSGMAGVSQGTQERLTALQGGYQPGSTAQGIQAQLQQLEANRPQNYAGRYDEQLNGILQQIQGQKPFTYEFNQDALFKSLSDHYVQQAKQASQGAQAQAAALTGGYGNSAAQMAASQAYQQALMPLYDRGMELARMAYDRHQGEQADRYNQLQALMNLDERDYGRNRDALADFERERDYLTGRYDTEEARALEQYYKDLDFAMRQAQMENQDYWTAQDAQERQRQFDASLAEQQRQADLDEKYRRDTLGWQQMTDQRDYDENVRRYDADLQERQRQADLDESYRRDTFGWQQEADQRDYAEGVRRYDTDMAERQRQADLDESYRRDTFNWQQDTDQRDYDEGVRRYDMDFAEQKRQFDASLAEQQRQYDASLAEQQRQYDTDQAMRQAQIDESIRQFNESLNWDKMSSEQKYAAQYALAVLENGQMPSEELLASAGLSAEDAAKLMAQIETTAGGGGTGSSKKPTYYVDIAGNYYTMDKNGKYQYVNPKDVDKNGVEDTSKINEITAQNIMNTWSTASAQQQAAKAAAAAPAQTAAQAQPAKQQSEAAKIIQNYDPSALKKLLFGNK